MYIRIIYFDIFIYSTCVEETALCSGTSFCANKGDLKWCKSQSSTDFESWPTFDSLSYIYCNTLDNSNEKSLQGQRIKKVTKGDGRLFNCLNRQDEEPFKKIEWQGNQPCGDKNYRRCLGQRSGECIKAECKFLITKSIPLNIYTQ